MCLSPHNFHVFSEISSDCVDAWACDSIVTNRCPSDSVLVYNSTQEENACCKTTYECRCDMSICKVPRCAAGHTPHILRHSNKRPGSCCDLYHCKVSGKSMIFKSELLVSVLHDVLIGLSKVTITEIYIEICSLTSSARWFLNNYKIDIVQ